MKILSISLVLLLINIKVFTNLFNTLYFSLPLSFIPYHLLLLIIPVIIVYFLLYRTKYLEHLKLSLLTNILLFIGSVLLFIFLLMQIFLASDISRIYIVFIPIIGKSFIFMGFISLLLENILVKSNPIKLYQKVIAFFGLLVLFSQLEFFKELISYFLPYYLDIDTRSFGFISVIIVNYFIALILVTFFSIFSNIISRIIYDKYNTYLLFVGVFFHLLWVALAYNYYLTSNVTSPNFTDYPYIILESISSILFLTAFIRVLLFKETSYKK